MNLTKQSFKVLEAAEMVANPSPQEVGESFLAALMARDFDALEQIFTPKVRFRSLVPSGERFGATAAKAVGWLRKWFGDEDTIDVLQSSIEVLHDVLSIQYRLMVHNSYAGWQVIEQQAYCSVQEGRIADMRLVCSGFLREPNYSKELGAGSRQSPLAHLGGTLFYDAGSLGCAEGPLDEIARLLRQLESGQTLEIHATDPSVAGDLPAWCRLSGHQLVESKADSYLIRHK
jgi:TusA-related sulfurtransferase